ncbi:hypothetical protein SLEP1_g53636 [Rubroshorea leprosula]|uniref:Uncharacterized protein n=1 Tax=Rubroshorea leprosula TaxID=152421 RepID=A0AAV5MCC6_9ROSI|nr:hypothetical protein SLEP1_g53636 [Rubroshorea leprosula]
MALIFYSNPQHFSFLQAIIHPFWEINLACTPHCDVNILPPSYHFQQ